MDYFDSIVLTVAAVVSYRKDLSDLIPIVSQRQKAWKAILYICGLGARFECERAREHSNCRD